MINRKKELWEFVTTKEYEEIVKNAEQNPDIPLCLWHAEILGRSLNELSEFDLIRCIRQDIFTDIAVFEIIERIDENNTPFYADVDSVELLEKLSSISSEKLSVYKEILEKIFYNVEHNNLIDSAEVWMFDEEKDTYTGYINRIKEKIK